MFNTKTRYSSPPIYRASRGKGKMHGKWGDTVYGGTPKFDHKIDLKQPIWWYIAILRFYDLSMVIFKASFDNLDKSACTSIYRASIYRVSRYTVH